MTIERHFTATGFVVHDGHIALHWHPKVRKWLPPGGHIEANEDPVQAVLREIMEETGVIAEVVFIDDFTDLGCSEQIQPPLTIMVEDIDDPITGFHQHIDMIYVCQPLGFVPVLNDGWIWVSESDLAESTPLSNDGCVSISPPQDVRILGERAFRIVEDFG